MLVEKTSKRVRLEKRGGENETKKRGREKMCKK